MKGIVEIYGTNQEGNRDLLYKGENMTMAGFSENIVDMLTTPSAVSGAIIGSDKSPYGDGYLDSRNYTINAFSTSKAKDQFTKNLHEYSTYNFFSSTDFVSDPLFQSWKRRKCTLTHNAIEGSEYGTSGHLLASELSAGGLSQIITYTGAGNGFKDAYFSATDFVFSIDVKMNRNNPPIQVSSTSAGDYIGYSEIALRCNNSRHRLFLQWNASGVPKLYNTGLWTSSLGGIKSLGSGWYRAFVHGIYKGLPIQGDHADTSAYIYPSLGEGGEGLLDWANFNVSGNNENKGSIYIARPQLELGIHPTNYVEVSGAKVQDNLHRFSRVNQTPLSSVSGTTPGGGRDHTDSLKAAVNYYVISATTGPTTEGIYDGTLDKGVSAYNPTQTELIPAANPIDKELVEGCRTPAEEAFNVNITKGQNSACAGLWDRLYVSSYDNSWSYTKDYKPLFGRHLTYIGTYPFEGNLAASGVSSTFVKAGVQAADCKASMWVHYVSANTELGMSFPVSSVNFGKRSLLAAGTTNSMPDRDGFISIINQATIAGAGDSTDTYQRNWSNIAAGGAYRPMMQNEILSDFSSTGEVTYHMRFLNHKATPSNTTYKFIIDPQMNSDTMLLNLFGGVNAVGLWGLDLKKMRQDLIDLSGNPATTDLPYIIAAQDRVQVVNGTEPHPERPFRQYKLYSKKVLTDNLVKNEGLGVSAGVFGCYENLDLYWKVKFL